MSPTTTEQVKEYYGRVLKSKADLKSSACCTADAFPEHLRRILADIDDEILERFYGCGSPIPAELEGRTVLDLGCGTGRDVYLASYLVGPAGRAIGIDMTDEQLEVARDHVDGQMARFGFLQPNVEFRKGYIEDLDAAGIEENSVDVVISNCVVNLSPDKPRVFAEIHRVLKEGGELYFSDVFAGRRVPDSLREDPVLYGECLGGALYMEDFRRMLDEIGFVDHRVVAQTRIELTDPDIQRKAGMIDFYSMTIRAFKLAALEDRCEDYGQTVVYKGTIQESPHTFVLDDHHVFVAGKPMLVCGNTASMLQDTRYSKHFEIRGDRSVHYGLFDCGPTDRNLDDGGPGGGCC